MRKLDAVYNAANYAVKECDNVDGCHGHKHTSCLQRTIFEYFNSDDYNDIDVPYRMRQNRLESHYSPQIDQFSLFAFRG